MVLWLSVQLWTAEAVIGIPKSQQSHAGFSGCHRHSQVTALKVYINLPSCQRLQQIQWTQESQLSDTSSFGGTILQMLLFSFSSYLFLIHL